MRIQTALKHANIHTQRAKRQCLYTADRVQYR